MDMGVSIRLTIILISIALCLPLFNFPYNNIEYIHVEKGKSNYRRKNKGFI